MSYRFQSHVLVLVAVLLVASVAITAGAAAPNPEPAGPTAATYITVTSTDDDYTDGKSKKCSDVPADQCTLRRAINQAYPLGTASRPVYIEFDIPTSDPGYNATLQVWKIQLSGSSLYDLRELYGQTILDGSTQPGGRTTGPKIIVDGLDNHTNGFILRQSDNEVRGLAFQNFENTHITISSNGNTIENCWFGLSDDGTTLSSDSDTKPEANTGISFAAASDGNTIRNNVFAGFKGVAAAIRGSNNVFAGNWIGARADGTIPLPSQFDQHPCIYGTWNGGSGISVEGEGNQIGGPTAAEGNHFVGLYLELFAITNQGPAINVVAPSLGHLIQNNVIGLDDNGDEIGICGRGIAVLGGAEDMLILDNTIVEPGLSGIMANHSTFNGNTLQGNIIKRESQWPAKLPGQNNDEGAIVYCDASPSQLLAFAPAKVLQINGTTVTGTSGDGSPCANCVVELFLDDIDAVTETLQSLVMVTAKGDGTWQATLPAPLEGGQGLRTMSTVPDDFTISGLHAGTTSNLSVLQGAISRVFLPFVLR